MSINKTNLTNIHGKNAPLARLLSREYPKNDIPKTSFQLHVCVSLDTDDGVFGFSSQSSLFLWIVRSLRDEPKIVGNNQCHHSISH